MQEVAVYFRQPLLNLHKFIAVNYLRLTDCSFLLTEDSSKPIIFFHINIEKKMTEFSSLTMIHAPDIGLGCETWLNYSYTNIPFINSDYSISHHDCSQSCRSGMCILV